MLKVYAETQREKTEREKKAKTWKVDVKHSIRWNLWTDGTDKWFNLTQNANSLQLVKDIWKSATQAHTPLCSVLGNLRGIARGCADITLPKQQAESWDWTKKDDSTFLPHPPLLSLSRHNVLSSLTFSMHNFLNDKGAEGGIWNAVLPIKDAQTRRTDEAVSFRNKGSVIQFSPQLTEQKWLSVKWVAPF